MKMNEVFMSYVVQINVRCEGDVNCFVDIVMDDGSTKSYHAIDGGFLDDSDNELDPVTDCFIEMCREAGLANFHSLGLDPYKTLECEFNRQLHIISAKAS